MNGAWSARWSREEADEFLFLVGDLWLILDREELLGDNAQQNKVPTQQLKVSTKLRVNECRHQLVQQRSSLKAGLDCKDLFLIIGQIIVKFC